MAELMLVNPRRKRRTSRRTPRRNARGEFMRSNPRRRTHATKRRRVHHRRRTVTRLRANPRRRTHHRRTHHRRVHRLRRNPRRLLSTKSFINSTLVPAGIGALGALGVDIVIGYAAPHLPTMLQSGMMQNVVKIAGAVGVGYVAGMVAGKKFGEEAMAGAITVTLYDIIKGYAKTAMPALPLQGYDMGWVSPAYQINNGMGAYVGTDNAYNGGMGMYVGEASEADYAY